jgi:hypothetical protein
LVSLAKWIFKTKTDMKGLGDLWKEITGIGKGAAKVGTDAAGTAGGAASSGASTAGSVGSAGGGGASSAGGGIMGAINMVSGIVTAVSSVVSNFQEHGMNDKLKSIENWTHQTANQLIYGIQTSLNTYLPALSGIHERLIAMSTTGVPVYNAAGDMGLRMVGAGGGGNSYTMPMFLLQGRDMDDLADQLVTRIKQRMG